MYFILFVLYFFLPNANAEPTPVPEPLQPWVGWVLAEYPNLVCPSIDGSRVCVWPGKLSIDAKEKSASFGLQVFLDVEAEIRLPGNGDYWPQSVQLNGRQIPVHRKDSHPYVLLPAGAQSIVGELQWVEMPEVIPVPNTAGQIDLSVDGKNVVHPRLEGDQLFLGEQKTANSQSDSLRASIYRKLIDGVPMQVKTRIQLQVSGRAREVSMGKLLLANTRPIKVGTQLPAQVAESGDTSIYVRPGSHTIEIDAVILDDVEKLQVPSLAKELYDPQEVWIWIPDEKIRSVELSGLVGVDPDRTSLPTEWKGNTTFLAAAGEELRFQTKRRGIRESPPNLLHLQRELWLDLDGQGFTAKDHITGTLNQGWRLNYGGDKGAVLGRVTQAKSNEDMLITTSGPNNVSGVELRSSNLDIKAELRLNESVSSFDAVGWEHNVQSLKTSLHLPPGWLLVGGKGVDEMRGTWLASWTLWHFFFVLMVALAVGKVYSWRWVPITIFALVLIHGHKDAPYFIWLNLVISLALLRALPEGGWRRSVFVYRLFCLVLLIAMLAPYSKKQLRYGMHPQVAKTTSFERYTSSVVPKEEDYNEAADRTQALLLTEKRIKSKRQISQKKYQAAKSLQQIDPKAVVQTGPGLPTWSWSKWTLSWSGPVQKDQKVTLWMISPKVNLILAFVRVALLIGLAILMVAPIDMYWNREQRLQPRWWRKYSGQAGTLLLLLLCGAFTGVAKADDIPPETLLKQLSKRLVEEQQCPNPCVTVSQADITVNGLNLLLEAEVHARKNSGWALPGGRQNLRINRVLVDGSVTNQIRRQPNGLAYLRIPQGVHKITLEAVLQPQNVLTIQFDNKSKPQLTRFTSSDWTVDGIEPNGKTKSSIQLTRKQERTAVNQDQKSMQSQEVPPWFYVTRELALGLPWSVQTTVSRVDASRPQLMKVPLLPSEKIMTEDVRVEAGQALVEFQRGEKRIQYQSEIPVSEQVVLVANSNLPFTEKWMLECSRIWSCVPRDLPAVSHISAAQYQPVWLPWPGEKLVIDVKRPQGAVGQPSTIDHVDYTIVPGKRLLQATLEISIRASQGASQEITLPDGADLQTVKLDGRNQSIRPQAGKVRLPIKPGKQVYVLSWQQAWERSIKEEMPVVQIGSKAVNANLHIQLDKERWLLWATGPDWGPAILFWSHFIILMIIAGFLGRLKHLPVKSYQWFLLVIGLSQLPTLALLPIILWFVILDWRQKNPYDNPNLFTFVQLVIVAMTILSVGVLFFAVNSNLLFDIDMQVRGMNSYNSKLNWYQDQVDSTLPVAAIISLPILVWRLLMLLWAFWLVAAILRWSVWGWKAFSKGGFIKMPTVTTRTKGESGESVSEASTKKSQESDSLVVNEIHEDVDQNSAESSEKEGQEPAEEQDEKDADD